MDIITLGKKKSFSASSYLDFPLQSALLYFLGCFLISHGFPGICLCMKLRCGIAVISYRFCLA